MEFKQRRQNWTIIAVTTENNGNSQHFDSTLRLYLAIVRND